MKKNLTELVFILDRSGSMGGLEQDTIGGFNAMLTRQKEQEGEANVTTILFDHEVQLLHDRFPLKAVAPLTEKDYYVRGCTALLDAIGYGVEKMVNIQRHLPEDERAEKVIFVITTDGLENASKRFGYEKIRRMIEREKEQYGWEFLFLGQVLFALWTDRILIFASPFGASKITSSPARCPSIAEPIGLRSDILPSSGFASFEPTM